MTVEIIVTCEHAGNDIPQSYRYLFPDAAAGTLASHRGWDPGAWEAAVHLADNLHAPLFGCHTSRLLIEVNRSLHHPELFSEFTTALDAYGKDTLVREIYQPYRDAVLRQIRAAPGPVFHLSMHSFTQVLHGEVRAMDIGLLFDPASPLETGVCDHLKDSLQQALPAITVAYNEPYKGVADGFTTSLRETFRSKKYAGVEIELNQKLIGTRLWEEIKEGLTDAVRVLRDLPPGL